MKDKIAMSTTNITNNESDTNHRDNFTEVKSKCKQKIKDIVSTFFSIHENDYDYE